MTLIARPQNFIGVHDGKKKTILSFGAHEAANF